jgi:hypothetical protein
LLQSNPSVVAKNAAAAFFINASRARAMDAVSVYVRVDYRLADPDRLCVPARHRQGKV